MWATSNLEVKYHGCDLIRKIFDLGFTTVGLGAVRELNPLWLPEKGDPKEAQGCNVSYIFRVLGLGFGGNP